MMPPLKTGLTDPTHPKAFSQKDGARQESFQQSKRKFQHKPVLKLKVFNSSTSVFNSFSS